MISQKGNTEVVGAQGLTGKCRVAFAIIKAYE